MGNSKIVINKSSQLSPPGTSGTGKILSLFEVGDGYFDDLGSQINTSLMGERLLLDKRKIYIVLVGKDHQSWESGSIPFYWLEQRNKDFYGRGSIAFCTYVSRSCMSYSTENRWRKDRNSTKKSDFYFENSVTLENFASLSVDLICCILKPDNTTEEELNNVLLPFGGIEDFDTRLLLFRPMFQGYYREKGGLNIDLSAEEYLKHIAKSRSYILPSPLVIRHKELKPVLTIVQDYLGKLDGSSQRWQPVMHCSTSSHRFSPISSKLTKLLDVYRFLSNVWRDTIVELLDPNELVYLFRLWMCSHGEPPYITEESKHMWKKVLIIGESSRPEVKKYPSFTIDLDFQHLIGKIGGCSDDLYSLLTEIVEDSTNTPLENAIIGSITNTSIRFLKVLHSYTYLSKDVYKSVSLALDNKVRWKGGRYEGERNFAGHIYAVKCFLKDPKNLRKVFESLVGGSTLARRQLLKFVKVANVFAKRESTLTVPLEEFLSSIERELCSPPPENSKTIFYRNKRRLADSVQLFILNKNSTSLRNLIRDYISVLKSILNSDNVTNSLLRGVQDCRDGTILCDGHGGNMEEDSLRPDSYVRGFELINSMKNISEMSDSTLLHVLFALLESDHSEIMGSDAEWKKEYVKEVIQVIEKLLELRSSVILEPRDYYMLHCRLDDILNPNKWEAILN